MKVDGGIVELELKYCERCGGLWLRVRGKVDVYCTSCALQIAEVPLSAPKRGVRKPAKRQGIGARGLKSISGQGGNT